MRIRPCIDLHDGQVKQIIGSTLRDAPERQTIGSTLRDAPERQTIGNAPQDVSERQSIERALRDAPERPGMEENFVSSRPASWYAEIYREKGLPGGHIILLNSREKSPQGYEADRRQALGALRAYPGGMQLGGGVTPENAASFLDAGASHVIVTSYVFREGRLDEGRLRAMQEAVGRERLVLDLSCRRQEDGSYVVVTDRWQKPTELLVQRDVLEQLSVECAEFLIHAADVEGRQRGVELPLIRILGAWQQRVPVTYAGGVHSLEDLRVIRAAAGDALDVTVGSALDLFGGPLTLDSLTAACGTWQAL